MVALPFAHLTLKPRKPRNPAYPEHLVTLGDHIRKRRLALGLLQRDVAVAVNATTSTVTNWEKNRTAPKLMFRPKIFDFLGYVPIKSNTTFLGDKIRNYRIQNGLSLRKLAKQLGIDPGTLAKWERGKGRCDMRICEVMRICESNLG